MVTADGVGDDDDGDDDTEEDGDGREITGSLESTMSAILAAGDTVRLGGVVVEVVVVLVVEVVVVEASLWSPRPGNLKSTRSAMSGCWAVAVPATSSSSMARGPISVHWSQQSPWPQHDAVIPTLPPLCCD